MSVTFPTRDEILTDAIAYFTVAQRNPITGASPPLGPRTWTGQQARALADLLSDILSDAKKVDDDAIPGTYVDAATGVTRTRNSSLSLESWAYALAIPSSVAGKFGRRGATAAKGGAAVAVGTVGVVIPTAAQLTDPSGKIIISVRAGITVDANPALNGITLDAATTGSQGSLPAGTKLRWSSPPPGLASTVTLTTALSGGYDIEDDVGLAMRIIEKLQAPLRGGTAADYRFFSENAQDSAGRIIPVDRGYPLPGRNGTGTVDICITQAGTGSGRDPGATVAAQVATFVDTVRPVGDGGFRIVRPFFDSAQKLTIKIRIKPATGFGFDYDDSQGTVTATTSTGSTGTSLVIATTSPPAALTAAFNLGSKPRIQVPIAGYALPHVARVTAIATNTPSGKTTLTLDTALPADPGSGVAVYAGGAAVLPVAIAALGYVDSVGPSRGSGAAPANDVWDDAVSVARLGAAAILATDDAGQPVCVTTPNIGNDTGIATEPGVLIKIGSGSFTADDFQLFDNDIAQGPQLPEVASLLVHRGGV